MKKNIHIIWIVIGFAVLFSTAVYADSCGRRCQPFFLPCEMYFIQLEGGYSWNTLKDIDIDVVDVEEAHSGHDKNGLSGRVALGLSKKVCAPFYATGEIGWGYYENSTFPITTSAVGEEESNLDAIHIKSTLDGFDVLAGVSYEQPCYALFLKAGALIQNSQTHIHVDVSTLTDDDADGDVSLDINQTQVLPEIKLGGAYRMSRNFAITASYSHAFGSGSKIKVNIDPDNSLGAINLNLKNPSLDTVMLGLQYCFG